MTPQDPPHRGHRQRLRERYVRAGLNGLGDHEVLELLLTYGIARKDVKPLAKDLLGRFGALHRVLTASCEELVTVKGVSTATAALLMLAGDCGRLCLRAEAARGFSVSSPKALYEYCRAEVGNRRDEQFRCFFVDSRNRLLAEEVLHEGTVDQTAVYPRKVFERALAHRATGVLFVHNHPSGSLEPSPHDLELTRSLVRTAGVMGIRVLDHLIVAAHGYTSFSEQGLL